MQDFSPTTIEELRQVLILAMLTIAVITDVQRRRIYNALTFPAMAIGLVVNAVADGPMGLLWAAGGLVIGAMLFAIPVAFCNRGAGDLKLIAAVGALGGPMFVVWSALLTGTAGAVFAIAVLLVRRRFMSVAGVMAFELATGQLPQAHSNIRLPYAIPIAIGTVAALVLV